MTILDADMRKKPLEAIEEYFEKGNDIVQGQLINKDGKQLRGLKNTGAGQTSDLLVNAWAKENKLVLA